MKLFVISCLIQLSLQISNGKVEKMFSTLTTMDDPFEKAIWYQKTILRNELAFCKKQRKSVRLVCENQARLRARRACDIAYEMANDPKNFAPYAYVMKNQKYNSLTAREKANICYVLGRNGLF